MNNKRIKTLMNRRQKIDDEIAKLRHLCEHEKINVITKSSSGYAEGTEYWYDCTCVACGTQFYADQENRKYINGTLHVKSDIGIHEILKVN